MTEIADDDDVVKVEVKFLAKPVVGQMVVTQSVITYASGATRVVDEHGTYLGVREDEGEPYHFFEGGYIGDTKQTGQHGFPHANVVPGPANDCPACRIGLLSITLQALATRPVAGGPWQVEHDGSDGFDRLECDNPQCLYALVAAHGDGRLRKAGLAIDGDDDLGEPELEAAFMKIAEKACDQR